jgi:DNA-binding response OmpR family regulator
MPAEEPPPRPTSPAQVLVVDREQRTASIDGRFLTLTYLEFELLAHLVAHPRRVHTRAQLTSEVWGQPPVRGTRTVDVHIARLRRKLGPEHRAVIVTVRQVGYTYAPP